MQIQPEPRCRVSGCHFMCLFAGGRQFGNFHSQLHKVLVSPAEWVLILVVCGVLSLGQVGPDGIQLRLICCQAGSQLTQDVHMPSVVTVIIDIDQVGVGIAKTLAADIGHPAQMLCVGQLRRGGSGIGGGQVLCPNGAGQGGTTFVFSPIQMLVGLHGIQLPVDEPGGGPETPGHQYLRGENLIQTAEDIQALVPRLGVVSLAGLGPELLRVIVLDGILDVDADLGLDVRRTGESGLLPGLVIPVTAAVEPFEPGGHPDVSLVIAQSHQNIVVPSGFDQIFQCFGFDIKLSCRKRDGITKLRTLGEEHIEFGTNVLVADGELCVTIREDAQRTGGPEELPTNFAEAQDQNMEFVIVDVFMERDIPKQIIAGGPETIQQPQLGIGEDQSLDLFCFLLRRAVGVAYCDLFLLVQGIPQMVDEHGSGFRFGEEVQLLLEHIVPGLPQRTKQPFVLDRLQELLHPLEILIGGFRQEEKAHPAESAKGPDEEAVFRFGMEVVVECSDVIQDLRRLVSASGAQEDEYASIPLFFQLLVDALGHADAVGVQLGEDVPVPAENRDMMGQMIPQKDRCGSHGGKGDKNRKYTGTDSQ